MKNIIAIDVGNGFCKAAILTDTAADPIDLIPAMRMGMQSVAYVEPNGKISVNPKKIPLPCDTVRDVKTHLGKGQLQLNAGGTAFTVDPGKVYGAVAGEVVRLANETLRQLGKEPSYQVVVTYPSEFIDTPKPGIMKHNIEQQVLDGHPLEVVAMLPEPVAAAVDTLYYEQNIKTEAPQKGAYNIAIYDLGHGTLDLAVVSSTGDPAKPFDVVCQSFPILVDVCGRVFDEKLYARLVRQLSEAAPFQPSARDYQELRFKHTVDMKHELSVNEMTYKNFIPEGSEDFSELSMSRKEFEEMIRPDIRRTLESVAQLLQDAQRKTVSVQEIVLTGGASCVPLIREMLQQTFGNTGIQIRSFRPTHAVVNGAARYAQQLVVQQHAEYAYGLYMDHDDKVHMMLQADDVLTATSKPLEIHSNSGVMNLRICRAKDRHNTKKTVAYKACDNVRWFPFDYGRAGNFQITLSIDADRRVTIRCTGEDGQTVTQSTFDQV